MTVNNSSVSQRRLKQNGYTLVEIMVAIVLGLLLTAALVQSYAATKQSYRTTEGVSRIQENARFAMQFVRTDLREAGFASCIGGVRNKLNGDPSDYISFAAPVAGWNYLNTNPGKSALKLPSLAPDLSAATSNWQKKAGAVQNSLPGFLRNRVAAGSDVLWFKGFEEMDITIKTHNSNSASIVAESAHKVPNNSIMLVGDCLQMELFQQLSKGNGEQVSLVASQGNATPGNRKAGPNPAWARTYGPSDKFYSFVQTFYYIGEGASGLPSLFRFRTQLPDAAISSAIVATQSEELVEGVESMQLLFGEDLTGDDVPNKYVGAHEVDRWDDIASVRLGLLLRSPAAVSADQDQASEYTLVDAVKLAHDEDDAVLRYVVNTTVKPRNRGLNPNLTYTVCDAFPEKNNEPDNGIDTCAVQG